MKFTKGAKPKSMELHVLKVETKNTENTNLRGNPSTERKIMIFSFLLFYDNNRGTKGEIFIGNTSLINRIKIRTK